VCFTVFFHCIMNMWRKEDYLMIYKAENSSMGDSMLVISIAALAIFSVLFNIAQVAVLKTVFAMLMLVSAMIGTYYVALIRTLQYRLTGDTLHIEGLFGLIHEVIPAECIRGYTRRITLISKTGLMGNKTVTINLKKSAQICA